MKKKPDLTTIARGKALRQLRNSRKLTMQDVASDLDIDQGNLSRIETGRQEPSYSQMRKLLNYYGLSEVEFDAAADEMPIDGDEAATYRVRTSQVRHVPLISWVQAGEWAASLGNDAPNAEDWVPVLARVGKRAYALTVSGDSMEPDFVEGDRIIVDPDLRADPGTLVVFKRSSNEEATFKRLISDAGELYLKPLNKDYRTLSIPEDAIYCGRVVTVAEKPIDD